MKFIGHYWGRLEKEWGRSRGFSALSKLFLGPVMGLMMTGVIYSGLFRFNPELSLDGMMGDNYKTFILLGFLIHTHLNIGFYALPAKLISEWKSKTLPLLFMAPITTCEAIMSLLGVEVLRSICLMCFISIWIPMKLTHLGGTLFLNLFVVLLGILLGLIRLSLLIRNEKWIEWFDPMYLFILFSGGLYIPINLMPDILKPFVLMNPMYGITSIFRESWQGGTHNPTIYLKLILIGPLMVFIYSILWKALRRSTLENTL